MSRRNQSQRRRNYGKRQHEVRERRPERNDDLELALDGGMSSDAGRNAVGASEEGTGFNDSLGSFGR